MVRQHFYKCFGRMNLIKLDKSCLPICRVFVSLRLLADKNEECIQMDINLTQISLSHL